MTKDQKLHSGACTCPACSPDLWAAGIKGSKTPGECNEGLDQSRGRASNAGLGSSPPIEAPSSNQCGVKGCKNTRDSGAFAGPFCAPCDHDLRTGNFEFGTSVVYEQARKIERAKRIMQRAISWLQIKEAAFTTHKGPAIIEEMQRYVGDLPVETTAMRSQEAFRLINAATYYVPRDREFHKDMVAWLGGASSAEASPEEPAARTNTSTGPTTVSLESPHDKDPPEAADLASGSAELCSDCPPVWYPTDTTRCAPCPRRAEKASGEPTDIELIEAVSELHHKLECDSVELDADAKRVLYSNIHRLTRRLKAREPLKCKCGRELVPYAGCPACDVPTQSGLVGPLDPPYLVGDK